MHDEDGSPSKGRSRPRRIKAVITDIDGTITEADRSLHLGAAEILRRLDTSGTPVILATSNVLPSALAIQRCVGLRRPLVAENGGILYELVGKGDRVSHLADRQVAWDAYVTARRAGLPIHRLFSDRWRETEIALEPDVASARLRRAVRKHPVLIEETGYATHIIERGKGKRAALDRLLPRLGITWSDCLVAGDGDNDVGMLQAAGWAVSFRSGSPKARRAADYVSHASYAAGLVEALRICGIGNSQRKP